jgi:hypothetical protein
MRIAILAAAVAAVLAQSPNQRYAGTWVAERSGQTYVKLELSVAGGALTGRISLADIQVDKTGQVSAITSALSDTTALFDFAERDSVLSFARKEGDDPDRFTMRVVGDAAAELQFLPSEEDRRELAEEGIALPAPMPLKRVATAQNLEGERSDGQACAVTKPPLPLFVPPARFPSVPGREQFWFGTEKLWTALSAHAWQLPRQRTFWWIPGFTTMNYPLPDVRVTGRRLDRAAAPLQTHEPNGGQTAQGQFLMVMVELPSAGCWQVSGQLGEARVDYVVKVTDAQP